MILKMCVRKEFAVFAANGSSPVISWLREGIVIINALLQREDER
jgi:hypothetical protein